MYQNIGSSWNQIGQDIDGEAANDWSGSSVSLSSNGSILAIGATGNDGSGADAGHVRVYQQNPANTTIAPIGWTQIGNDINGEASNDYFGTSVSLSADGSILAIGASNNDGSGADAGHVRVYQNQSGSWNQIGQDIDGEAADDRSGYCVSLSADGNKVAIGAIYNDGSGTDAGHVRVYQYNGTSWTLIGSDINGEEDYDVSGWSVSLSGDGSTVAIGAKNNNGNGANDAGHVRVCIKI